MEMYLCSVCKENKPISEYYVVKSGKRIGQKKSSKCKQCFCKVQYKQQKNSETKKAYKEKNKDKIREYNYNRFLALKDNEVYKAITKKYQIKYNNSEHGKRKRKEYTQSLRVDPFIKEINAQLRKAKRKEREKTENSNKIDKYSVIAARYKGINTSPPKEIEWRDVVGYEGLYRVSNHGEVYSCVFDKVLKQMNTTYGYLQVSLHKDKAQKKKKVHRLVAEAFINNPNNKELVNHIDSNRQNNNTNNLEWVTEQDNMDHKICNQLGLINVTY